MASSSEGRVPDAQDRVRQLEAQAGSGCITGEQIRLLVETVSELRDRVNHMDHLVRELHAQSAMRRSEVGAPAGVAPVGGWMAIRQDALPIAVGLLAAAMAIVIAFYLFLEGR